MTLNEYQEAAMSTRMDSCNNDAYMMIGLVGEVGELASKMAKAIRKDNAVFINNKFIPIGTEEENKTLIDGMRGEIGDCLWFIAGLADQLNSTLDTVGEENIAKLHSRKERGVIIGDGDNR